MNLAWEDISHLLCSCGKDHCDAANHADGVSPERYARDSGCESKEIYEAAERIAVYVNDLARLQEEGWKRAQAILADERRKSPNSPEDQGLVVGGQELVLHPFRRRNQPDHDQPHR